MRNILKSVNLNNMKGKKAKKRIDAAIKALGNYDKSRVTEINSVEDSVKYLSMDAKQKAIDSLVNLN